MTEQDQTTVGAAELDALSARLGEGALTTDPDVIEAHARDEAQQAYAGGAISLTEVLDADRDLLAASDRLALAQAGASRAAVSAFRALGGGWRA